MIRRRLRVLLGLLFLSSSAQAGPMLRLVEVDASRFPEVRLLAEVGKPGQGERAAGDDVVRFSAEDSGKQVELRTEGSRKTADRLVLVTVFDATESIPANDFVKARTAAVSLLGELQLQDRVALYEIKGGPRLIQAFAAPADLSESLGQIQRTGKTTRVFDALHLGISAAREGILRNRNTDVESSRIARAAVLLFTDGRDENSYLSEEDCSTLAQLGARLRVPVYIVLYGRTANHYRFQRLALRTGGEIVTGVSSGSMKKLADAMRILPEETYRLSYTAPGEPGKREVILRLSAGKGKDEDSATYLAAAPAPPPARPPMIDGASWLFWIIVGAAVLLLIGSLIVALVVFARKQQEKRRLNREAAALEAQANRLETPSDAQPVDAMDVVTQAAAARSQEKDPEEPLIVKDDAPRPAARGAVRMPEGEVERVEVVRVVPSDELPHPAMQYLRESAYRTLQEALRDAPRYESGSLIRRRDGIEREYDLFLDETGIGSGRWASIRVEDSGAAKMHARIKKVDGKYVLYDLLGGSGVYLNSKKILRPRALRDGDEIKMGRSTFQFRGRNTPRNPA